MINWLNGLYLQWLWQNDPEAAPAGLISWLDAVKIWWRYRPQLIECASCQRRMWWNGSPRPHAYCSQDCAATGPYQKDDTDTKIPF
jgi:hypothetical protein